VIVVGAGPTGLMLAGGLALAGVAVDVIQRQAVPCGRSRGGGIIPAPRKCSPASASQQRLGYTPVRTA
jgi:2-polyprenyl-6-methoxyphenol hydroxylase-like FAD-dependent oxidoreductase